MRLIPEGSAVCDVGCGRNPLLLDALAGRAPKRVGLDRDVGNALHNGIELRNADFSSLPLPIADREFDAITLVAVLEHLEDPEGVLRECRRGLKKRGRIILTSPSPPAKPVLEFLSYLNIISREGVRGHKHYFNAREIERLLSAAGFKNAKAWGFELGLNNVAIAFK